ncbi:MAG TPA: TetR/AcrR family transcriptional regulator, partial [Chthoniobacterales bacterium]|nr:TetR/AcrR family transcriptional regulator [Chthoniobacterales bacterium]
LQGATTRDIATVAGVNEVTIFRHFHTRDELLGATLKRGCAALDGVIHYEEILKGELADGLEHFIRETYSVFKQRETIVRAFIGEAHLLPESFRCTLQECMMRRKAVFVAVLKQAQELGLVRWDVDVSAVADCFRDSIHGAMLRHTLYNSGPETVDAHLRGITDIFYRGIKANDGRNS